MIKIRVSYTDDSELSKVLEALSNLRVIKKSKVSIKNGHKNMYIEAE